MFFSRLFAKNAAPEKAAKPPEKPGKPAPDRLTEMRRLAGTGDPKLKGKHRSGTF